ncbi:MAG: TRAP transporter substrate-binding protein [Proteobacteria bacterium]|nr:TRAP transporter substrate-binding protein [Pseudomonadota bacterium]
MKRSKSFLIGFAIVLTVMSWVFSGCEKPVEKVKSVELSYSIFFPQSHAQAQAAISWAKEVEKRSDGRVKIKIYPGGTLTKAKDVYDGVVNGISDIGMSCFAYTRGRFPLMEAVDLPMGYSNGKAATLAANEFFKEMKPDELNDVKVLYLHAHGPGLLHTQKKVASLNDLKGMKIRSTGLSAKVVEALGGVPVPMSQGETYEALQKGVVEGTFSPIETLKGWRQAEVVKNTTVCSDVGYTTTMFAVMNLSKWNVLPEDLKTLINQVSEEWIEVHGNTWDKADVEGREYTLSRNNSLIELEEQENLKWIQAVKPIMSDYVNRTEQKGLPGKKALGFLKRFVGR